MEEFGISFGRLFFSHDFISGSKTKSSGESVAFELPHGGMIILGLIDTEDPSVDVSAYLKKSQEFREFTEYHNTLLKRFPQKDGIPLGRQIKAGHMITLSKKRIMAFEKNVRRLVILSGMLSLDTPSLLEIKQCINAASYSKAYEVLKACNLYEEQKHLLEARNRNTVSLTELDARLIINATGIFLKALLFDLNTSEGVRINSSLRFFSNIFHAQLILSFSKDGTTLPEKKPEYRINSCKTHGHNKILLNNQIISSKIFFKSDSVPVALHNLGVIYYDNRDLEKAETQFLEALTFFQDKNKRNPDSFTPHIAAAQANLALLYGEKKDFLGAKNIFHESIHQFRELVKKDSGKFLPGFAQTLKKYADTCTECNDLSTAVRCYREAIDTYRILVKIDEERFQPLLLDTLDRSIELSIETGMKKEGSDNASEALALCRNLVRKNPDDFSSHLVKILTLNAIFHLEHNLLDPAEMELREVISICRRFRKLSSLDFPYTNYLAKALNIIGVLYMTTNRPDLANRELSRSIVLYHQLTHDPREIFEMCKVLNNLGFLFQQNIPDRKRSITLACEAIFVIRPWIHIHDTIRAIYLDSLKILHYWGFPENMCYKIVQDTKIVKILKTTNPRLYN